MRIAISMSALLSLFVFGGCSSKSSPGHEAKVEPPRTASPARVPTDARPAAGPADDDDDDSDGDDSDGDEVYLDFDAESFAADLDGDGRPEQVSFTCGESFSVSVEKARATGKVSMSDLIGCSIATAALRPGQPGVQLVFVVDEHDEAGPDSYFIYAYRGARLSLLWSGAAELTFLRTGAWVASTGDCDEERGVYRSDVKTMSWDGTKVTTRKSTETRPLEEGECDDP